jgi:AcrR family transcriptional regulator
MQTPGRQKSRKDVLLAAAELFKEKGYAGTSMRELAHHVGIEASSLYSHIKSKSEILIEICMGNAISFTEGIDRIVQEHTNTIERLEAIIQLHIDIAVSGLYSVSVFNDEWKHLTEPHLSEFLHKRQYYEQQVLAIIKEGVETGQIRTIDPKVGMYTFLTALRWVHYRYKVNSISKEKLFLQLRNILLEGFAEK